MFYREETSRKSVVTCLDTEDGFSGLFSRPSRFYCACHQAEQVYILNQKERSLEQSRREEDMKKHLRSELIEVADDEDVDCGDVNL